MIILSLCLAFWVNYGVSRWGGDQTHNNFQWKMAMAIQIIPGGFMFLMMFFVIDTPRALIANGKRDQGLKNLCKLRGLSADHPYVREEFLEVTAQVDAQLELAAGNSYKQVVKDIFTIAANRRRFFLASMLFLFHKVSLDFIIKPNKSTTDGLLQFTGTDSLNYFAPEIFQMIGVQKGSLSLLTTGVYGVVKLVTTIFYVVYIVDRVGRRRPLILGAFLQATAMLYIGLYVRFAHPSPTNGTEAGGIVGIIWIYIYAFGWSFGWSVAPYVVAAEIFPSRIRSVSMSWCFFLNWIVDYGLTRATPSMMSKMGYGTFLLYACLTYVGAAFVFFCMPEMKGRSIESMDDLFQQSLWGMWRHAYPTEEDKTRHGVHDMVAHSKAVDEEMGGREGKTEHNENVEER